MNESVLINGSPGDRLSIQDRGLQYGDGLFETVAVRAGQPLCWQEHLTRLEDGCRRIGLRFPGQRVLTDEAESLLNGTEHAVLKLTLTRGTTGRGYRPSPDAETTRILSLHPWPDYPPERRQAGVHVRVCNTRLGSNPVLGGMKHLNRLEQVMARGEWDDPAIAEGLMQNQAGDVIEGTMSNLFVYRAGVLMTPDVGECGIAGIIRGRVMSLANDMAIDAMIATIDLHDVESADELFLCNSLIGVWPVTAVGEKTYPVGEVTCAIRDRLVEQGYISAD